MNVFLRLRPYLKNYYWLIIVAVSFAFPLSAIRMANVPLVRYLFDEILAKKDAAKLALFPLAFIALFLLNFVVRFTHAYTLRYVVVHVNQRVKNRLFNHTIGLSSDYFTTQSTGQFISRVGADPFQLDAAILVINVFIREPVTFVGLFGYAVYLNWRLTILILFVFPFLALLFKVTGRNLKRYVGKIQEANANLFSTIQESITGIRIVKLFKLEQKLKERFEAQSQIFAKFYLKTVMLEEITSPAVELALSITIAGIIYYGGSQVISGQISQGALVAFFTAVLMMMNPIRQFNDINNKLASASAVLDRINELLSWKSRLIEKTDAKSLKDFHSSVQFNDVKFAYPDDLARHVLNGISFELKKGKSVALVGASGAGKSSLVTLLPRLYDVTSGSIQIDGTDLRDFKVDDVRSQIAVVSQEVFLFNDTIAENIRCGRLDASDEEVREAARKANAIGFIEAKPEGFKTIIGDRGQKLSGGERQRISIARAFLRNSPILILDEATSSLDNESERQVQIALEKLMQGKTSIVIAHRLSTIQNMDRILVLREGLIVEEGSHEELLKREGEFAKFHRLAQGAATIG